MQTHLLINQGLQHHTTQLIFIDIRRIAVCTHLGQQLAPLQLDTTLQILVTDLFTIHFSRRLFTVGKPDKRLNAEQSKGDDDQANDDLGDDPFGIFPNGLQHGLGSL